MHGHSRFSLAALAEAAWRSKPAALLAVTCLTVFAAGCGGDNPALTAETQTGVVGTKFAGKTGEIAQKSIAIAASEDRVWISSTQTGSITPFATNTLKRSGTVIPIGASPYFLQMHAGSLWATSLHGARLFRIDPATGEKLSSTRVGKYPFAIAGFEDRLYVTSLLQPSLNVIDTATGKRARMPIKLPGIPYAVAASKQSIWVTNIRDDQLIQIDRQSGELVGEPIAVGRRPGAVAAAAGSVWVANTNSSSITQVNAKSGKVVRTIAVGKRPQSLAVLAGKLYVANMDDDTISVIDLQSGKTIGLPIIVGNAPSSLAVSGGSVWIVATRERKLMQLTPR